MTLTRKQLPIYEFTANGFKKIKKEQETLLAERPLAVEDLQKAREMGDLSENGYYKAARAKLSSIDSRLRRLAVLIKYAKVVNSAKAGEVGLGSKVTVKSNGKERKFEIVGNLEADPLQGKLSNKSPIGKALLGKKVGDRVEVSIPSGRVTYVVTAIA
ncbi:MAG: transcription elongation factor GreA [Patescibacteria group bacterium]|jgi:transcription elongation factor GreA